MDVDPTLVMKKLHTAGATQLLADRPALGRTLGCDVAQAVPPKPDHDPISMACGLQKRVGWNRPPMTRAVKKRFKKFVHRRVREMFKPLKVHEVLSPEAWIDKQERNGTYTPSRCRELRQVWEDHRELVNDKGQIVDWLTIPRRKRKRILRCKSFQKEEHYPGYKFPRSINSRSDFFKVLVGPIFDAMGNKVFHYKKGTDPSPFIKLVPVRDRPLVVKTHLYKDGAKYYVTDASSFEAHFDPQMMGACEFELYKWLASGLPYGNLVIDTLTHALLGTNELTFKEFTMTILGKRMSGEMNTSLGNGFSNLMFTEFVVWARDPNAVVKGFFEGDDGLFTVDPPTSSPTAADYQSLGINMKQLEVHDDLGEASFCGMLFHPEDPELTVVTDPLKVLAKTGWTSQKYVNSSQRTRNALLRCKAYSIAYCYAGCPILDSFGQYLLRSTLPDPEKETQIVRDLGWWERTMAGMIDKDQMLSKEPHRLTRELVDRLYNISPTVQTQVETYLNELTTIQQLDLPMLSWPKDWMHYSQNYVVPYNDKHNCVSEVGKRARMIDSVAELAFRSRSFVDLIKIIN